MTHRRDNVWCTAPSWQGRADCRRCPVRSHVLFADIDDDRIERTLVPIDNLRYAPKSVIYALNDPGRAVFSVRRGAVKLLQSLPDGASRVVRVLTTGDLLGMEALIDRRYAHTAVAMHALDICRIPIEVVHKLSAGQKPLYPELMRRWQDHLDQADTFITQLSTGDAHTRMARLLLLLDSEYGVLHGTPLSREDMGQILGMSTETASRIIAGFKRESTVREDGGVLHCADRARLQRIAAGG